MLPASLPVRFLLNPRGDRDSPYGSIQRRILNAQAHQAAFREISTWPGYAPTPLLSLPGLAADLGVDRILYKDEGTRFGMGSFKALGGIYGVFRVLQDLARKETGAEDLASRDFSRRRWRQIFANVTVTCASAGNHGRAVARGAQMFGCNCVVFLPKGTPRHRIKAIEGQGARILSVAGGYDDAVLVAAKEALVRDWQVVSDTSFPGYRDLPGHIMQGYTILAREVLDELPEDAYPTHVFLQAGVGGLAGAVAGHLWERLGPRRPRVIVVEPLGADCLMESALRGKPTPSSGALETSMTCLACRRVSRPAWVILKEAADAFMTISDGASETMVELLKRGTAGDPEVSTQPSGAAGLAGLLAATFEPGLSEPLELGSESRILVIGSEGPA